MQYFDKLLVDVDEETLSPEERKERKIMTLLLKIKNGTPPMRKVSYICVFSLGNTSLFILYSFCAFGIFLLFVLSCQY